MTKIKPFAVEEWMFENETGVKYNIAETCCASISLDDLQQLSDDKTKSPLSTSTKLTYGTIRGSEALRTNLAKLYSSKVSIPLPPENILITPGAIQANFEVLYTLTGPGDHVICIHPTYQQLYSVPESLGAEVSLWRLKEEENFLPNFEALEKLVKPNTKLIILNNPNNPTGVVTPKSTLRKIVDLAKERDIIILSDEVYRPLFHSISPVDEEFPPSIINMGYSKVIATGSLSKAFSLAGIRVGWIASRDASIIAKCAEARDYTTISVSQLDDQVATYAMAPETVHNLLSRNLQLAKKNLDLLDDFIRLHDDICSYVKPKAGTTAFVKICKDDQPVDDAVFCKELQAETGIMFCPGRTCFGDGVDFKGYVRIGYACETEVLVEGLKKLKQYFRKQF